MADSFDYAAEFGKIETILILAADVDVDRLTAENQRAESIGPILYPSEYRRGMKNLDTQREVLRAFAPLARKAQELLAMAKEATT